MPACCTALSISSVPLLLGSIVDYRVSSLKFTVANTVSILLGAHRRRQRFPDAHDVESRYPDQGRVVGDVEEILAGVGPVEPVDQRRAQQRAHLQRVAQSPEPDERRQIQQ